MWVQEVKLQIVNDYHKLLSALFVGKAYDYSHILDMINFLEIHEFVKNPEMLGKHFIHK